MDTSNESFDQQSLLCLMQDAISQHRTILVDPKLVTALVGIQRSLSGQLYYTHSLERSLHFTIKSNRFEQFTSKGYHDNVNTPFLHIPNTVNYTNKNIRLSVINYDTEENKHPISRCTMLLSKMFQHGLSKAFNLNEKKRGFTFSQTQLRADEDRNANRNLIPTITLGYTNQVTQEYRNSRSTICGHICPFLRNGNIPCAARKDLLQLVKIALSSCTHGQCFEIENGLDTEYIKARKSMIADFEKQLGGECYSGNFRVEGIAIIIPFGIGCHRDNLNCSSDGMNSVVAVHGKVNITETTLDRNDSTSNQIRGFLAEHGYTSDFPCGVILYSRKICHIHALKMSKIITTQRKDPLRDIVFWALTERVGSCVDYNAFVFDNADFETEFLNRAETKESSRYSGLALRNVAAYDKSVSSLPNYYFILNSSI